MHSKGILESKEEMKHSIIEFIMDMGDGGAQTIVRDYATVIDKSKFNLFIYTIYPKSNTANSKKAMQSGAQIISAYKKMNLITKIYNKLFRMRHVTAHLGKTIRLLRPECIHVHMQMLKYLVPIRDELKGVKILYTCHSLPERYFGGSNQDEFKAANLLINECGLQLIALHDEMRIELNKMFGVDNTVVIRNGIDLERFGNVAESKDEIRQTIGVPCNAFLMGHVGRFAFMKNHTFLLDVFKEVLKVNSNAYLLLIGSGPLLGDVLAKAKALAIEKRIVHLQHRTDIPRLMKAMDVFVFPSIFEGLPVSVVEAQACNIRCVVSENITKECCLTPLLTTLSLNLPAKEWAEKILDTDWVGPYDKDLSLFDMKKEIKRLENMYIN